MVERMFDPITLDQLRAFVTVVEEGSFSAAARKLKRVQSAISTAMSNLEDQLGVALWDRATKIAKLTPQGQSVLAAARRVLLEVDSLKRLTAGMATGLEPTVSLCVDALFPLGALVGLCTDFAHEFGAVDLRVDTRVMSSVTDRVLDGSATIGVVGPQPVVPGLDRRLLATIMMIPVTGPDHPLAKVRGLIPEASLADAIQIVLSEMSERGVADQAVLSPRTWRVADLATKHALLRASLGWGNLPEHLIRGDLRTGKLVRIRPEAWADEDHALRFAAVTKSGVALGPAHRWVLDRLQTLCSIEAAPASGARPTKGRRRVG
jgi:DNA-binding transcriptional LysR family regulator